MPAVQTEPLTCPACNKTGTRSGQGVSRFRHQETREPFGKCHHCNHSWPLEPQKGRVKTPFPYPLREWARKRGIITEGLDSAPVKSAAWVKNDGTISPSMTGLVFEYGDGVSHWISINKLEDPDRAGKMKYVQKWTPKNASLTLKQLWTWQNVELENPDPETAYLCEGEKDALTLGQAGFLAFAVPGAQSLREDRAKWLADRLKAENITRLRICFDFDQGGKSGTALSLSRLAQNYSLKIEVLKWPEGTKDGADVGDLARTFGAGFGRTLLGMEWVNPWADPSAEIVEQVEPEDPPESSIQIYGSLYRWKESAYAVRNEDGTHRAFSDFVMDILRQETLPDGSLEYLVELKGAGGRRHKLFIPAQTFADSQALRKCCRSVGPFHCNFNPDQLWRISAFEAGKDTVKDARRLMAFGWNEKLKSFVFPTGIVQDGTFYEVDPENQLITTPTGCYNANRGEENQINAGKFPQFTAADFTIQTEAAAGQVAREIIENTAHIVGEDSGFFGTLIFSWFVSTLYLDTLFDERIVTDLQSAFPFLMFVGEKGSGKTETMSRFLQLYGFRKLTSGDSYRDTTSNYYSKIMALFSNIPFWMEEIQNQPAKITVGTIKASYNRGAVGHGTKKGMGDYYPTATLAMCGEEPIQDIYERSIVVTFPHKTERTEANQKSYIWMNHNAEKMRALFGWLMKERTRQPAEMVKQFIKTVSHFNRQISVMGSFDARTRQNHAIALGGLGMLPDGVPEDIRILMTQPHKSPFWEWYKGHIEYTSGFVSQSNPVVEGLSYFLSEPECIPFIRHSKTGQPIIYLPTGLLGKTLKRISGFPFDRFNTALTTAPYCLAASASPKIPKSQVPNWEYDKQGVTVKSIALDGSHPLLPEGILDNSYAWDEADQRWKLGHYGSDENRNMV